jgi:hypothetical protein
MKTQVKTKIFLAFLFLAAYSLQTFSQKGESGFKKLSVQAQTQDSVKTPLYRGYGDPLKGLDIAKAKKSIATGNYYALIIGIDKYQGEWPVLKNAVNDASGVAEVLKKNYDFSKIITLYDKQATRVDIIKTFEWLVNNAKDSDNVFIFYSGHGDFKQTLNKGYWVPVDANTQSTSQYISNSDIQTFLGGIKAKHTLLVSDACFSGDLFRGKTVNVPFENTDRYYQKVYSLSSRQALTSGGVEPVMDGGKEGHSIFTYYLIKAFENNQNKFLDAYQLYEKLRIPVINNSEQTPFFNPIKNTGDEGGEFVFMKK